MPIQLIRAAPYTMLFAALAGCLPFTLSRDQVAWEHYARPSRLIAIDHNRRLNLYCAGNGSPTVILEAGLGRTIVTWRKVHAELARLTRICAYDRAGFGFSDPAPMPRTSIVIVADLERLLRGARIAPPYVFVAHSSGSLHARLYAYKYPDKVAGMVLIDPATEHQEQRFTAVAPEHAAEMSRIITESKECVTAATLGTLITGSKIYKQCIEPPVPDLPSSVNLALLHMQMKASYQATSLSEYESLAEERENLPGRATAARPLGDMPLIVLTAADTLRSAPGQDDPDTLAQRRVWERMHAELAQLSSHGERRDVPGAQHSIQLSRPEVVINAVSEVIADIRQP